MRKKINIKQYLPRAITILIFTLLVITFSTQNIYAQSAGYKFTITGANPANGATNVPQNLQSNTTGTSCSSSGASTICTVMVGIGISSDNPTNGIGYPIVDGNIFNSSAITITSPNDQNLATRFSGNSENNGAGNMNFYHTFSFFITNNNFPNGLVLMPNSTYTITVKGGINGFKAYYDSNNQHINAYLNQDYSWSFTTGDGSIPLRQQPNPTPTTMPTQTINLSATTVIKPSCPEPPKPYELYAETQGVNDCTSQWARYRDYLAQQYKPTLLVATTTPSATPTSTAYIPPSTFTSTPSPTVMSTPIIKHMPTQTQKQINHNNSLLQNIGKFFEKITTFFKNFAERK